MKALVTGAAGLVGSNLCVELQKQGHEVVALDSFSTGSFENLQDFRGDVIAADLRSAEEWQAKIGKVDAVFHQAAITDTTVHDQKLMMSVNVEAFRLLLEWAAKSKVKRVVYASSAGVYGDRPVPQKETVEPRPLNVYAFSKMVMETVARQFQKSRKTMSITGLRYFNVYGPRETHKAKAASMAYQLYLQMKAGKRPRIFEFGEQYRDFIYVKDVVNANLLAAKAARPGVFNVCTGRKTTFSEIIRHLNETMGLSLAPDYFKNPYSFYQNETLGDPGAAQRAFGFSAQYTMAAGIKDYFGAAQQPVKMKEEDMPSLRDIRNKIKSVKSTEQITKAMKMVAAARMRKSQLAILAARPFAVKMEQMARDLAAIEAGAQAEGLPDSPVVHSFFEQRKGGPVCLVLVTADKGLCGAFNSNLIKAAIEWLKLHQGRKVYVACVGRKGRDFMHRLKGYDFEMLTELAGIFPKVHFTHAELLGGAVITGYEDKKIESVTVIYNEFKSVAVQRLMTSTLLPIPLPEGKTADETAIAEYGFEPGRPQLLAALLPRYLKAQLYRVLLESQASELAARMNAMDAASKNAKELRQSLNLGLNRQRQAMITREIAELVGGAEALAS